ncbi:MAG: hypothetical protein AAF942_10300 [Pseudomonadota bacterium]
MGAFLEDSLVILIAVAKSQVCIKDRDTGIFRLESLLVEGEICELALGTGELRLEVLDTRFEPFGLFAHLADLVFRDCARLPQQALREGVGCDIVSN